MRVLWLVVICLSSFLCVLFGCRFKYFCFLRREHTHTFAQVTGGKKKQHQRVVHNLDTMRMDDHRAMMMEPKKKQQSEQQQQRRRPLTIRTVHPKCLPIDCLPIAPRNVYMSVRRSPWVLVGPFGANQLNTRVASSNVLSSSVQNFVPNKYVRLI